MRQMIGDETLDEIIAVIVTGGIALATLIAIILTRILPLQDEHFRSLVIIREGIYLYAIAAIVLVVTGIVEKRRL